MSYSDENETINLDELTECTIGSVGIVADDESGTDADAVAMEVTIHGDDGPKDGIVIMTPAEAAAVIEGLSAGLHRVLERREG